MREMVDIFKALADETRLRILKLLEVGELCVCDITAALDMVQPKVSFHLKVLKNAGLLRGRRCGKWMHYDLDISDILKRMLIMTVIERLPEEVSIKDRKRLQEFLRNKQGLNCGEDEPPTEGKMPTVDITKTDL